MQSKLKPWKVQKSDYVLQDRWISLRADRCETSQGVILDPYYVIEFSDWADICAFDPDMNLILIKQYRHGVGEVVYELPGGIIEDGNPRQSALHELRQETGYRAGHIEALASLQPNPAKFTNTVHVFLATDCTVDGAQQLDTSEEIEVELVSIPQALKLIESGVMRQGYHISEVYMALRRLKMLELA